VCLAGLSPAVVTETLYALVHRRPRVVPREVRILTTARGFQAVVASLFGSAGALAKLREICRLPASTLLCTPDHVHVLCDARDRPLEDIRDAADSRAAGEQIGALIRDLAGDPAVQLHCSLAGGRKTMSALLATALQLHGRPGDRLYHVLVNAPFDRIADFFFPPRPARRYRLDGQLVDSRRARVELAEVPFVPLGAAARRLGYSHLTLERIAAELDAEAEGRLVPAPLTVALSERRVRVGEAVVRLRPQEIALYAFYARARMSCRAPTCREGGRCQDCHLTDDHVHDRRHDLLAIHRAVAPGGDSRLRSLLSTNADDAEALATFRAWLQQTRSRLNRALREALGPGPRGARYLLARLDAAAGRRHRGLAVIPAVVRVDTGRRG
jgi:CRISPR-associated protein (TIGR02584 family)